MSELDTSEEPGNCEAREAELTGESLTRERNIFLVGTIGLAVCTFAWSYTVLGGYRQADVGTLDVLAVLGIIVLEAGAAYFVFRLSRFLSQPVWLTVVYCFCILMFFTIVYLIPFVGLLVAVGRARSEISIRGSAEQCQEVQAPGPTSSSSWHHRGT
jgi:hypothetical protein